jgi:hypothetical protein
MMTRPKTSKSSIFKTNPPLPIIWWSHRADRRAKWRPWPTNWSNACTRRGSRTCGLKANATAIGWWLMPSTLLSICSAPKSVRFTTSKKCGARVGCCRLSRGKALINTLSSPRRRGSMDQHSDCFKMDPRLRGDDIF